MKFFFFAIVLTISLNSLASEKGLLHQILITNDDETLNLEKTVSAEIMITKAEEKAILKIKEIIRKETTSSKNAENYFRLAELYNRRAKTYHFFEINKDEIKQRKINTDNIESIIGFKTGNEKNKLQESLSLYKKIIKEYPQYIKIDSVIFNAALTEQKLGNLDSAIHYFDRLVKEHSSSEYFNEALLLASEIEYSRQKFENALKMLNTIKADETTPIFPYVIYKKAWNEYNLKNVETALNHMKKLFQIGYSQTNKKYSLSQESLRDLSLFAYEAKQGSDLESYLKDFLNEKDLISSFKYIQKLYFDHSKYNQVINLTKSFFKKTSPQDYLDALTLNLQSYEILDNAKMVTSTINELISICSEKKSVEYCKTSLVENSLEIIKKWWAIRKNGKNHTNEMNDLIMIVLSHPEFNHQQKELLQILATSLNEQGKFNEGKEYFGNFKGASNQDVLVDVQKHFLAFSELKFENKSKTENATEEKNKLIVIYENFIQDKKMRKTDIFESANDRLIELYFSSDRFLESRKLIEEKLKRIATLNNPILKIQQKLNIYFASQSDDLENYKALLNKSKKSKPSDDENLFFTQELYKLSLLQADFQSAIVMAQDLSKLDKSKSNNYRQMTAELNYLGGNSQVAIETYISILSEKFDEEIFKKVFYTQIKDATLRARILKLATQSTNKDYLLMTQLENAERLFKTNKFEEAFKIARTIVSQGNDKNLKAKARFIQAQILKNEFEKQSLKSSTNKTVYLILVKNEKFEKAQKSLLEALSLAQSLDLKSSMIQALIENSLHFSNELRASMEKLNNDEKNQIQGLLSLLEKDRITLKDTLDKLQPQGLIAVEDEFSKTSLSFFKQQAHTRNIQQLLAKRSSLAVGLLLASLNAESQGMYEKSLFLRKNLFDYLVSTQAIDKKETNFSNEHELNAILVKYFEYKFDMKSLDSDLKTFLTKYFEKSKSEISEG